MKIFRLLIYLTDADGNYSSPKHFDYPSKDWCKVQWEYLKAHKNVVKEMFPDYDKFTTMHKMVKEL